MTDIIFLCELDDVTHTVFYRDTFCVISTSVALVDLTDLMPPDEGTPHNINFRVGNECCVVFHCLVA
jgi:hypothetical protein